jgi:hypothetical protein
MDKPQIIKDADFKNWCSAQKCDLRDGCMETFKAFCEAQAQLDADVLFYEPLIQQARQEVAREVDDFLQMHLYARPDRVNTTMGFNDWMDLKELLSKYGGQK